MLNLSRSLQRLRARAGFTIVEFLVVFVMLGILGGTVTMVLLRQQRFYNNTLAFNENRAQIRQALNVMPLEIWSLSGVGGDIYSMTDSSIDFRAVTGASIVCRVETDAYITIPPVRLAKGPLTTWVVKPARFDSVLVYDDSTSSATARDDQWRKYEISSITDRAGDGVKEGCPSTTKFTQASDLVSSNPAFQLVMLTKVSKTILDGAPVRFFRKVHYSLYKEPSDGKWYLGFYDCRPGRTPACSAIRPVSGPYMKYSPANGVEKSGLTFTYYDSLGVETTDRMKVARINVVVRAAPDFASQDSYYQSNNFVDSLRFDIALRNRK